MCSYQGESRILDSREDVYAGQPRFEYPATSVPFSRWREAGERSAAGGDDQRGVGEARCAPQEHLMNDESI
jgi:hypothetical protein